MSSIPLSIAALAGRGVEVLARDATGKERLPEKTRLEAPCRLKGMQFEHSLELGRSPAGSPAVVSARASGAVGRSAKLRSRRWHFAPRQLTDLDVTNPNSFLTGIFQMTDVPALQPSFVDLATGLP